MTIVETHAITGGVDTRAGVHVAAALDPVGGLLGGAGVPRHPCECRNLVHVMRPGDIR
jgi:hypothetical protein